MALTEAEELELLELEAEAQGQQQSPVQNQQKLVEDLTRQGVDPAVLRIQQQKADLLGSGKTNAELPFSLQENPFETTGQNVAEDMGRKGRDPYVSAAAGTAFTMLPDIAMSLPLGGGTATGAKAGANVVKTAVTKGKGFLKRAGEALTSLSPEEAKIAAQELRAGYSAKNLPAATAQGEARLAALKTEMEQGGLKLEDQIRESLKPTQEKLKGVLAKKRGFETGRMTREAQLADQEKLAKEGLNAVEQELGIGGKFSGELEAITRSPEMITKVAQKYGPILEKGPEAAAKELSPQHLQAIRKIFQESEGQLGNMNNAFIQKYRETAAKALEINSPKFGEARGTYLNVKNAQGDLTREFTEKKASIQRSLDSLKTELRQATEDARFSRKAVKATQADELRNAQNEIDVLRQKAKTADAQELESIRQQGRDLVKKSLENAGLKKKLTVAGKAAATVAGVGGVGAVGAALLK